MEALVLVLSAMSVSLFLVNRGFYRRLKQVERNNSALARQQERLAVELDTSTESCNTEAERRAEFESKLIKARESATAASEYIATLESQLQDAQQQTQVKDKDNAELVAELRVARRQIKTLRNEIAKLESQLRLESQQDNDATKRLMDMETLLDEERKNVKRLHNKITELESELMLARQDDCAASKVITKLRDQLEQAHRKLSEVSPRRSEVEVQLEGARRDVERLTRDMMKLETELKQSRQKDGADAQRIVDLEAQLTETSSELERESLFRRKVESQLQETQDRADAVARHKATIEEKLKESRQSSHINAKLESEVNELRERCIRYSTRLEELDSQLTQADVYRTQCCELAASLKEASEKENRTYYEHLIRCAIEKLVDCEPLFRKALRIESKKSHHNDSRSRNLIRAAKQEASFVEQIVYDAIKSKGEGKLKSEEEPDIEDQILATIDAEATQTGLKVADVISLGRRINDWKY